MRCVPSRQANWNFRVLLGTMKHLGKRPCPRCLVETDSIGQLGTEEDEETRIARARVDDADRRRLIKAARKLIFEKRHRVNSAQVGRLLDAQSLTPIEVRMPTVLFGQSVKSRRSRMPSLSSWVSLVSTSIQCWSWMYCTS